MNNLESLSHNQETGVGFSAIKERMRAMLSGGTLEQVAQRVDEALDSGVDTILQTITWLKENYRALFVLISPVLLAACATFTDNQPVSAEDIQKSLDKQRAGAATQEMSADQLADLQATPVATAIPTRKPVTPTRVPVLPESSNLSRGADATEVIASPAPEIVTKQYLEGIVTADSLNIRSEASTTGLVTGKLSKGETIRYTVADQDGWLVLRQTQKADGSWEDKAGLYVSAQFVDETGEVTVDLGSALPVVTPESFGGQIDKEELLASAKEEFGTKVTSISVDEKYPLALAGTLVVGEFKNGVWQQPSSTESIQETATALEVEGQVVSFEEFKQIRPDLVSSERIGDGNMFVTHISGLDVAISEIDVTTLQFRINPGGTYDIMSQNGEVAFHHADTHNPDELLNGWMQPALQSEKGLFKFYIAESANDPSAPRLLPDKKFKYVFGVLANTPELIDQDAASSAIWKNANPQITDFLKKQGFLDATQTPTGEFVPTSEKLDSFIETFFKLLQQNEGVIQPTLTIKLPNGEDAIIDTTKGVNFQLYSTPGDLMWLKDINGSSEHANSLTNVPYTVENGQLTVYLSHNFEMHSWTLNSDLQKGLGYVLQINGIQGDSKLTALGPDIVNGVPLYSEFITETLQWVDKNEANYLVYDVAMLQGTSPTGRATIDAIR